MHAKPLRSEGAREHLSAALGWKAACSAACMPETLPVLTPAA